MTKFVSIPMEAKSVSPNQKYVKQTNDALTDANINLELIATQIGQLPIREQHKFFRLLLNYVDITSQKPLHLNVTMQDVIMLCERLMDTANDFYDEQENQLAFEGM
jgi:hypothetical protein